MKLAAFSITILLACLSMNTHSQDIHIGIEPFPPIITENGKGYAIEMLQSIEAISDLTFHFHIMNYARAKKELKNHHLDMIGLTPKGYETKDFYQYAEDIKWSITTKIDLFVLNTNFFNIENIPEQSIGTLRGNADFFSESLNIPRSKFVEISSLPQLTQMLERKRLNIITFERASTMLTFKKFNITDVHYKNIAEISASFAVQNNKQGRLLKAKIDKYLTHIKSNYYFTAYLDYLNLADTGEIPQSNTK
jgi:polar amino acid transport system substrate-binding protein